MKSLGERKINYPARLKIARTAKSGSGFLVPPGRLAGFNFRSKEYIVRYILNRWLVLRVIKNKGKLIDLNIVDSFNSKKEAQEKCRLSNYIIIESRKACRREELIRG